MKRRSSLQ